LVTQNQTCESTWILKMVLGTTKPNEMNAAESWLPELFCGQAGRVANVTSYSRRVKDVADKCIDGWRISSDPQSILHDPLAEHSPRYRQANIGVFFLNIEIQHCKRPVVENRPFCVLPGDVVVPRIPPLHASLVSESNHRHPIDGNCYIVRGMKPGDAAWLLALLNEKEFEAWFMARSGSQALPRIGLKDLRNCPFPDPPEGVPQWSTRLFDWVERYSSNANRLFSLQSEVSHHVSQYLSDQDEQGHSLFPGVREPAVLLAGDSWLPVHVESEYQQRRLVEKGALRLKDLVVAEAAASARLRQGRSSMIRLLKITDVTGIYIPSVEPSLSETRLGRFFAEPVKNGEVLVSTMVTYPKIAYGDTALTEEMHPIDHWVRFTFRKTPGAWALVLSSPAMIAHFRRLATGSALQFTNAGRLIKLCVPNIDSALRKRWQSRLDELLADRRHLDKEWNVLRLEGRRMVASVLNIPWGEIQERSMK